MNILVVDDEQLVLQDTIDMLMHIEIVEEIKSFFRSKEALAYVEENPVDVAVLDIDMPGINGLTLAQEILSRYPKADVIFTTGFSEFAHDAYKVHASGYLMKPIKKTRLQEELEHIASVRSERE